MVVSWAKSASIVTHAHQTLQVKLTIQKEVFTGVILQQVFVVELVVHNFQCMNCHMVAADNTWRAVVQVRQKVNHKRTFFLLEQLILKYKAHMQTVSVKEVPDGIDFYFLHRNHAMKFQDFVLSMVGTAPHFCDGHTNASAPPFLCAYTLPHISHPTGFGA
jgi:NMD protein affecting ribosome stability and mRNA decay